MKSGGEYRVEAISVRLWQIPDRNDRKCNWICIPIKCLKNPLNTFPLLKLINLYLIFIKCFNLEHHQLCIALRLHIYKLDFVIKICFYVIALI